MASLASSQLKCGRYPIPSGLKFRTPQEESSSHTHTLAHACISHTHTKRLNCTLPGDIRQLRRRALASCVATWWRSCSREVAQALLYRPVQCFLLLASVPRLWALPPRSSEWCSVSRQAGSLPYLHHRSVLVSTYEFVSSLVPVQPLYRERLSPQASATSRTNGVLPWSRSWEGCGAAAGRQSNSQSPDWRTDGTLDAGRGGAVRQGGRAGGKEGYELKLASRCEQPAGPSHLLALARPAGRQPGAGSHVFYSGREKGNGHLAMACERGAWRGGAGECQ